MKQYFPRTTWIWVFFLPSFLFSSLGVGVYEVYCACKQSTTIQLVQEVNHQCGPETDRDHCQKGGCCSVNDEHHDGLNSKPCGQSDYKYLRLNTDVKGPESIQWSFDHLQAVLPPLAAAPLYLFEKRSVSSGALDRPDNHGPPPLSGWQLRIRYQSFLC